MVMTLKSFFFFLIIFEITDKIFARFLPWRVQKQNIVALGSVKQFCSLSQCCVSLCTLKILCITLQSDYCNWVHLDKVDQSDYRKLTILWTKKVCCEPISSSQKKKYRLLEAQNLDIDSKRFSGKQNVSPDNVFLFETWHNTVTSKGHI